MSSFDFDQSTALPWDLQRHLEALVAGQGQQAQTSAQGAQSYREGGGQQDQLWRSFVHDDGSIGKREAAAGLESDGAATPFARASLQVPFFRWVSPLQYEEGRRPGGSRSSLERSRLARAQIV